MHLLHLLQLLQLSIVQPTKRREALVLPVSALLHQRPLLLSAVHAELRRRLIPCEARQRVSQMSLRHVTVVAKQDRPLIAIYCRALKGVAVAMQV